MSIEDEARAELVVAAERLKKYHGDGFIRSEFRSDMNTVLDSILLVDGAPRKASHKVEAAPSGTDREALEHECEWECVSEMEHLERAYDGLKVEYADYRNSVRTRLSQAVRVELTDEMVEKAMVAAIQSADIPTGMRGTLLGATPTIRERVDLDDVVRVVLKAALGGGE